MNKAWHKNTEHLDTGSQAAAQAMYDAIAAAEPTERARVDACIDSHIASLLAVRGLVSAKDLVAELEELYAGRHTLLHSLQHGHEA